MHLRRSPPCVAGRPTRIILEPWGDEGWARAYTRSVQTSSVAMAVHLVWKSRSGLREIEHLGSGCSEAG